MEGGEADKSTQREVEILHFDSFDAVANRNFSNREEVDSLLEAVSNGVPPTWKELAIDQAHTIFKDSENNPQYVAITRRFASPEQYKDDVEWMGRDQKAMKEVRARNSLINEITLSPKIKELIKTNEATEIAKKYGYDGVDFIEPLVGIINKETKEKTMFYKWQNGYSRPNQVNENANPNNPLNELYGTNFTNDFIELFRHHGIEPNDIGVEQFIAEVKTDGKKYLHLTDIEAYVLNS